WSERLTDREAIADAVDLPRLLPETGKAAGECDGLIRDVLQFDELQVVVSAGRFVHQLGDGDWPNHWAAVGGAERQRFHGIELASTVRPAAERNIVSGRIDLGMVFEVQ